MPRFDDIDIFDGPALDAMGVPITGSSRDMHLQMAESIIRDRYVDPLQDKAEDALKMKVSEALESVPGITGSAIAKVVAMADSNDPDDKRIFNQLVSKLNLPFDVRRTGDDYRVSKRFQDVLGDNSNVGVSAYLPDEGDNQYRIEASKRFPDFLGGEASVSANMSTEGGPEIRANFVKRFAEGGSAGDIDIFGYNLGGSVGQMMGRRPDVEIPDLSPAQMANIGAAFADPLGMIDITGEFPEFPTGDVSISGMVMEGPRSPSLAQNLREGNYGSAVLQGIGVVPVVGGAMRAARGVIKGADRLERAKKAGFDTDTVYYHATDKFEGDSLDFTSLKPSERGKLGPGIYIAQDPRYTEKYIRTFKEKGKDFTEESFDEGARILPVFIRGKVGTDEDFGAAIESVRKSVKDNTDFQLIKRKAQKKMAKDGFSGFKVGGELVIFNPKDVRSVNAVFEDPKSAELLKANGGSVDLDDIDVFEDSAGDIERLLSRMPTDMGPLQMAIPEEEGLRSQLQRLISDAMGGDRQAYRRAKKILDVLDFIPVAGDATAAIDTVDYAKAGMPVEAGIASIGLIPGVGGILAKGAGKLKDGIVSLKSSIEDQISLPLGEQKRLQVGYYHPAGGGLKLKTLPKDMDYELSPSGVLVPSKTIKPEDMEGGRIIFDAGDRAVAGQKLVRINGIDLEFPIDLMGGPEFMMYQKHLRDNGGIGSIWAGDKGAITALGRQAVGDEETYFMPTIMTQTGLDFNTMMSDALIQQISKMKITKKTKKEFDKVIKKIRPEWKGIDHPEAREQLLESGPLRHAFIDRMDKAEFQSKGFPDVAQTRVAITDPAYLDLPFASGGMTIGRVDKSSPILNKKGEVIGFEPVQNPNLSHATYNTQLSGDYMGGFEVPIPRQILAPDFYKQRREMGVDPQGDARSFQLSKPSQQATPEWVDTVSEYIEQVKANQ